MIVVRFKVKSLPGIAEEALARFKEIVVASRPLDGVVHFDIGRDITDPNSFIATEVFVDREAMDRQELLPEVKNIMALFGKLFAGEPEATIYDASPSES